MGLTNILLITATGLAVLASTGMAALLARSRLQVIRARAERDRSIMAEAATMRMLRVSVTDIRADAMCLLGHVERLTTSTDDPTQDLAGVLAMTEQIMSHTDDMQDYAVPEASTRRLELETLPVRPLIEDAVAAVSATLGPSVRHWRIGAGLDGCALLADRRAMSHILGRVLSNAARHSRHDDAVDISVEHRANGLALVVEDEGSGLLAPNRMPEPGQKESRGMGLGLVLARMLMEAHGGLLAIESASRVGTRVTLSFPPNRVASRDDAVVIRLAA
ncbi:MAG: sensor histidine kinase [Acetobacteraceae bacterium]